MVDLAPLGEIIVLPFFGPGHLNPCLELGKQFAALNYKTILIIPSTFSSYVPSDQNPLVEVVELPYPPPPKTIDADENGVARKTTRIGLSTPLNPGIENLLCQRYGGSAGQRPICAVVDVLMRWSVEIFAKWKIPIASFFTSGAYHPAMEYAKWNPDAESIQPGEDLFFPGLPHDMPGGKEAARTDQDDQTETKRGPAGAGKRFIWWEDVKGSSVLLFNTCDDLEALMIKYIADQTGIPVYGIGPLLPKQYWKSAGSLVHDYEVRSNKTKGVQEDEVIKWLDSKPEQSVIYISFGSEVTPTSEELAELAKALEESKHSFIWGIPPGSGTAGPPQIIRTMMGKEEEEGFYPDGLEEKVGKRGLIIKGWAPQLLILSHPSVGGFLSHCGWNSTLEAIGRGVPILAWPIGGDQFNNAKLIVTHLGVGHTLYTSDDLSATMKKEHIMKGIEMMMDDQGIHTKGKELAGKFQGVYPSVASLEAIILLLSKSTS